MQYLLARMRWLPSTKSNARCRADCCYWTGGLLYAITWCQAHLSFDCFMDNLLNVVLFLKFNTTPI